VTSRRPLCSRAVSGVSQRVRVGLGLPCPVPACSRRGRLAGAGLGSIARWSLGGAGGGVRSGPGEARTILLLHIISARPSKQRLMVRTFLKVYMELGSYFVSARTNKRRHHHLQTRRETEAHFTAAGMSSQRKQSDSLRFKRAAFYQSLKSKVGLAAAKSAALRIKLNGEGCGIVAAPVHAPSRAPLLLPLLLSHNIPLPRVH